MTQPAKAITESRARTIAWDNGLARIEEIGRIADIWEVSGRDRDGTELILEIDARDGSVRR